MLRHLARDRRRRGWYRATGLVELTLRPFTATAVAVVHVEALIVEPEAYLVSQLDSERIVARADVVTTSVAPPVNGAARMDGDPPRDGQTTRRDSVCSCRPSFLGTHERRAGRRFSTAVPRGMRVLGGLARHDRPTDPSSLPSATPRPLVSAPVRSGRRRAPTAAPIRMVENRRDDAPPTTA